MNIQARTAGALVLLFVFVSLAVVGFIFEPAGTAMLVAIITVLTCLTVGSIMIQTNEWPNEWF